MRYSISHGGRCALAERKAKMWPFDRKKTAEETLHLLPPPPPGHTPEEEKGGEGWWENIAGVACDVEIRGKSRLVRGRNVAYRQVHVSLTVMATGGRINLLRPESFPGQLILSPVAAPTASPVPLCRLRIIEAAITRETNFLVIPTEWEDAEDEAAFLRAWRWRKEGGGRRFLPAAFSWGKIAFVPREGDVPVLVPEAGREEGAK